MNLALRTEPVHAVQLLRAASYLRGLTFSDEEYGWQASADGNGVAGSGNCVSFVLDCLWLHLWPDAWNGRPPLELRRVRVRVGSRLGTLDDFPVLREFLELNARREERAPKAGDIVTMRWGNRQDGAAHHVVLWGEGGFHHLPIDGVSGFQPTDELWESKIVDVWRLNAISD